MNTAAYSDPADEQWDDIIGGQTGKVKLNVKEIWRYRDLLTLFVKRDFVTVYKQTVLGPIWFLIQPVFTTLIYIVVFGRVAKLTPDTIPPILFFMGSISLWNYFSDTLNVTSKTFTDNAAVFGKVYFPRMILPLSKAVSGLIKLLIQFGLFLIVWVYYVFIKQSVHPTVYVIYLPFLLLVLSVLSLGFGIIVTSLTTKYRDLTFLITFGVQLLMYGTPIIYPLSKIDHDKQIWLWLNPLTSIFEAFKYAFLGQGALNYFWLGYSILFTTIVFLLGLMMFGKVERRFIDTV